MSLETLIFSAIIQQGYHYLFENGDALFHLHKFCKNQLVFLDLNLPTPSSARTGQVDEDGQYRGERMGGVEHRRNAS